MSIIIINNDKLFFQEMIPSFTNNESTAIKSFFNYGSFCFIAIRPVGFLPAVFAGAKNYTDSFGSTWGYTTGILVDWLGMLYRLKLISIGEGGGTSRQLVRIKAEMNIVDIAVRADEFEIIAASPDVRDSAMAYMYMGFSPEETIAKIQMQFGYPEIKVASKTIPEMKQLIVEGADKSVCGEFAWREIENMRKHRADMDNTDSKVEVNEGN